MKITRMQLRDVAMPANSHNADTYGKWCAAEALRIGGDARVVTEERKRPNGDTVAWCRVDRF